MTEIVYICECGKIYHFHKRFAGRTSRCISCRKEYMVPRSAEGAEPPIGDESLIEEFVVREFSSDSDTSDSLNDSTQGPPSDVTSGNDSKSGAGTPFPFRRTEDTPVLQRIGRYDVHEKIGAGGMGNVYYAWDTQLQREVTIKTTNAKGRRHKKYKERFINEARIAGKLVHSGIITIYSLDYDDAGEPYYAMRLLEGRTMEQLATQYHNLNSPAHTPEQLRKLIRHFIDACQTVAYANDNHVVHRDIKPANIMLGGYGETVVLDWGLAKVISTGDSDDEMQEELESEWLRDASEPDEDNPELTLVGARVGTAGYQSPEYLRGEPSQPSDDLYALGVALYHVLCNKLPYALSADRRGVYEMMMTPPIPPHLVNPHATRPLSAICLCALAFEKERRYPSAAHLAADLQRWLDGEPVSVYRMNTQEKIMALLRKKATLFGGFVVFFGLGFLLAWTLFGQ